jgi:DNA-binding transcriptional ArsR family regulator
VGRRNGKASQASSKPLARSDELGVEELDGELLIYDHRDNRAHSLGSEAARVWRACDGKTDVDALSARLDLEPETVARALVELEDAGLLDTGPVDGLTRRMATKKMARLGAAAASAPLVYSILAPTPALAQTNNACSETPCQSGCGHCFEIGCACCGPGGGDVKFCTQDCSDTFCNPPDFEGHCGTPVTSVSCASGPT